MVIWIWLSQIQSQNYLNIQLHFSLLLSIKAKHISRMNSNAFTDSDFSVATTTRPFTEPLLQIKYSNGAICMFIDVKPIRIATLSNEEVLRVPVFVSVANLNIKQIPVEMLTLWPVLNSIFYAVSTLP